VLRLPFVLDGTLLALLLDRTLWGLLDSRQQVAIVNACAFAGAVGQDFVGQQPAAVRRLTPPDSIARLLEVMILPEIQRRKHHQAQCGQGQ